MGNCIWKMKVEVDLSTLMDELELELSKIVGLVELKDQLRKWAKGMVIDDQRRAVRPDFTTKTMMPHMIFHGNPGTGKTMIARMLGKLLCSVGVLSKDKVVEVQRSDLVGEYVGHTGPKTRAKIEEAMGGVLFVDEAYRLIVEKGSTTDFGVQALDEIMSVLEDRKIVVIFAGYTEKMKSVMSSNEGFTRRVTHSFHFKDYSCQDLAEMLIKKMTTENKESRFHGFNLHPSCTEKAVQALIKKNTNRNLRSKLNGGLVDHMLNLAMEHLNGRLPVPYESGGDVLFTITLEDLVDGVRKLTKRVQVK